MVSNLIHIFGAGFVTVFLLGFQSRSVNNGNYLWAAGGSFLIALAQVSIWEKLTAPTAGLLESVVYGLSGATGITSAMYIHKRYLGDKGTAKLRQKTS